MDWLDEVNIKQKRKNQILFTKDSTYLQDLVTLFQKQDHRVMILWAFDFAAESIAKLEAAYPDEKRPREALETARAWASGNLKMRTAQRKILECHAFAKNISCKADIATCHAIGQACSVVHTAGHAIGYPVYDLTSIVYQMGVNTCMEAVELRKQEYIDKIFYWNTHFCDYNGQWAAFLLR